MGVSLAKVALSPTWAHLSPQAQVLLAYMAITAKDDDKPPRYFGGRDALVLAVYARLEDDPEGRSKQQRYVRMLLQEIKAVGGLVLINEGHIRAGNGRAEYEIRVLNRVCLEEPTVPPVGGTHTSSSGGRLSSPSGGTESVKEEEPTVPPKEQLGATKGLTGGDRKPVPAQTYVATTPSPEDRDVVCARCGRPETRCRSFATKPGKSHDFEPRPKHLSVVKSA